MTIKIPSNPQCAGGMTASRLVQKIHAAARAAARFVAAARRGHSTRRGRIVAAILLAALACVTGPAAAQGTTPAGQTVSVSNLAQSLPTRLRTIRTGRIATSFFNAYSRAAQRFSTGGTNADRFLLREVGVVIYGTNGNPGDITVAIHDDVSGSPATAALATLTGPARPRPTQSRTPTFYTASDAVTLAGGRTYFVVITTPDMVGDHNYRVDLISGGGEDSGTAAGWSIADVYHNKNDNGAWIGYNGVIRMVVRATVVPPTIINTTVNTTQMLSDGDVLTVTSAGTINAPNNAQAVAAEVTYTGAAVYNSGTIRGSVGGSNDDHALEFTGDGNILTNRSGGTINNGTQAGNFAAHFMGNRNTVTNAGTITASEFNGRGVNQIGDRNSVTVENGGSITASGSNDTRAVNQTGAGNRVTVEMGGAINNTGSNFSPGVIQTGNNNAITIESGGSITTNNDGETPGIEQDGNGNFAANHGSITTSGGGFRSGGIRQLKGGNTFVNTGTITGNGSGAHAVVSAEDGNAVTNSGTITSGGHGIELFGDRSEITMTAGRITANNGHAGIALGDDDGSGDRHTITITGGMVEGSGGNGDGIRVDGDSSIIIVGADATIKGARYGIFTDSEADGGTITVGGRVEGGTNGIRIEGSGNTVILEATAVIVGELSIGGNTLIDNRPIVDGSPVFVENLSRYSSQIGNAQLSANQSIASRFTTGNHSSGYYLRSLAVGFEGPVGSPPELRAAIHAAAGNAPGAELAVLHGESPSAEAEYEYIPPFGGVALAANTTYYAVLSVPGAGTGNYRPYFILNEARGGGRETTNNSWRIDDLHFRRTGGGGWSLQNPTLFPGNRHLGFRVNAVAGPMPANRAPTVAAAIPPQNLSTRRMVTLSLADAFADADNNALQYRAGSDNPAVATATVTRTSVTISAGATAGTASITVAADDGGGVEAVQTVLVTVRPGPCDGAHAFCVSNVEQPGSGRIAPVGRVIFNGTNRYEVHAQGFRTGGAAGERFLLGDVSIGLGPVRGNPGDLVVAIHAAAADGTPAAAALATLTGTARPRPGFGNTLFTWTPAAPLLLAGDSRYFVVLRTPDISGAGITIYDVNTTASDDEDPVASPGWSIVDGGRYGQFDGGAWAVHSTTLSILMRVRAYAAVELAMPAVPAQNFRVGAAVRFALPAATGGAGSYAYSLAPALPAGLSFDAAPAGGAPAIVGAAQSITPAADYTYTATDAGGATAAAVFAISVLDAAAAVPATAIAARMLQAGAGTPLRLDLTRHFSAPGELTYTATSGNTAVATARVEEAMLLLVGVAEGDATITVTARAGGGEAVQRFVVTVMPAALGFAGAEIPPQNYSLERRVNLELPTAVGGRAPYTYSLNPAPPLGLAFDGEATPPSITGMPQTVSSANYVYAATDARGERATLVFTLRVTDLREARRIRDLGEVILPQVARVMMDSTASVISDRVYDSGRGGARVNLAGFNPPLIKGAGGFTPGTLGAGEVDGTRGLDLTRLQSLAEWMRDNQDRRDWKPMLEGSGFVVPVAVNPPLIKGAGGITPATRGARGNAQIPSQRFDVFNGHRVAPEKTPQPPLSRGGKSTAAFWGRGVYRDLSGQSGSGSERMTWDGNLTGAHLGFDAKVTPKITLGIAASALNGDMQFQDAAGKGDYDLRLNSFDPYLGWRAGKLTGYLTAGGGGGKLTVQPDGRQQRKGDVRRGGYGIGLSTQLRNPGATLQARLKGELVGGELSVDGGDIAAGEVIAEDELAEQDITATRARLSVEANYAHARPGLETIMELGLRNDGGDGATGSGLELGLGWAYRGIRVTSDLRLRGLLGHSGDAKEWGVSGGIRIQPGRDGQGLSLDLTPAYGATNTGGISAVWQENLPANLRADANDAAADSDYALRLESRVGYGLRWPGSSGLFTPFAGLTHGGGDSQSVGLFWKVNPRTDWSLIGERGSGGDAVLLRGSVILER